MQKSARNKKKSDNVQETQELQNTFKNRSEIIREDLGQLEVLKRLKEKCDKVLEILKPTTSTEMSEEKFHKETEEKLPQQQLEELIKELFVESKNLPETQKKYDNVQETQELQNTFKNRSEIITEDLAKLEVLERLEEKCHKVLEIPKPTTSTQVSEEEFHNILSKLKKAKEEEKNQLQELRKKRERKINQATEEEKNELQELRKQYEHKLNQAKEKYKKFQEIKKNY